MAGLERPTLAAKAWLLNSGRLRFGKYSSFVE
jgi:hypothetical protein